MGGNAKKPVFAIVDNIASSMSMERVWREYEKTNSKAIRQFIEEKHLNNCSECGNMVMRNEEKQSFYCPTGCFSTAEL